MINNISKITIYVQDQEQAKNFWVNKLKFIVKFEQQMGPNMKWIEVAPNETSQTTFVLYDKNMMKTQNPKVNIEHPSIILSTTNIEEAYTEMKNNSVTVGEMMTMPYGKMFSFKDCDNNDYLLREDK
ncbi:putative enzyme related to lactoylglutathione lyase [Clostridium saccharoperbutylacetonicum]|uniref:Lactoylglutathione lyase family protein n=1 Tax=Clostridium saccharoperbutylacetonicum N1-4(HMT) TaxID=931276 RepID=M1MQC7_9CLOT|nr:VOC family protein [Clostridium saccharoperbutylacetonicum]AGF56946.1 lactoylglutathione lyase family protein [Clostridium saccharoperbutylacetonicum N1-4(HMT)]NRT62295.1 putative enzyme related to lactoylglutathione lyase [Clostridium saccharoperbutylacetonicum]NSB25632.1 putative enzyme related to lactoylglutathione lyase [Clostridium saccharoperbutylacetonicum]NSB44998.1 putative enzyme related to lactoylglutathione lyase [Clostridium saccharoperbutylacetonicum]